MLRPSGFGRSVHCSCPWRPVRSAEDSRDHIPPIANDNVRTLAYRGRVAPPTPCNSAIDLVRQRTGTMRGSASLRLRRMEFQMIVSPDPRTCDIHSRIEALRPGIHRMARRFFSSEKDAADFAGKAIARAKQELSDNEGENAVKSHLFRLMCETFVANLQGSGRN